MESSVRGRCVSIVAIWSSAVWWPARRSCLAFCWFGFWRYGTVCLMVAARRVHGSGGRNIWWSSVLSSHIAGCRCPGGREAHLRRCAGTSGLLCAGLSGWEWCSSCTRLWCSQSGCSPECNWTSWGFLSSGQISSVTRGRRDKEEGVHTGVRLLKSTTSSLVLLMFREKMFLWHQLVRVRTSSL